MKRAHVLAAILVIAFSSLAWSQGQAASLTRINGPDYMLIIRHDPIDELPAGYLVRVLLSTGDIEERFLRRHDGDTRNVVELFRLKPGVEIRSVEVRRVYASRAGVLIREVE